MPRKGWSRSWAAAARSGSLRVPGTSYGGNGVRDMVDEVWVLFDGADGWCPLYFQSAGGWRTG